MYGHSKYFQMPQKPYPHHPKAPQEDLKTLHLPKNRDNDLQKYCIDKSKNSIFENTAPVDQSETPTLENITPVDKSLEITSVEASE